MSHFASDCQLALGISASSLDSLGNMVVSLHEQNFRGMYAGLLISCQEKANGETVQLITDNAMDSVKSNYDDNVESKSVPP